MGRARHIAAYVADLQTLDYEDARDNLTEIQNNVNHSDNLIAGLPIINEARHMSSTLNKPKQLTAVRLSTFLAVFLALGC